MISNRFLFFCFTITGFIITIVSAQRCANQEVFEYFSCDQSCTPVASSLALIRRCTSLVRFGCELRSCGGGFECAGAADGVIRTCANSRVIFREPTKTTFDFIIDLNTPPRVGDYYFLVNTRRQMSPFIPAVQESILEFINSLNGDPNVRLGIGIFRNENVLDMGYRNVKNLTRNHGAIRRAVNRISAREARRGPSSVLRALVKASTQQFRPTAQKIIFTFGDNPGHEPSRTGGDALNRTLIANALKDANISFVGINYRNRGMNGRTRSFGISPEVRTMGNQASFIAEETGGVLVFRDSVFDAFWRSKSSTDRKFDLDPFTCSEFIDVVPRRTTFPITIERDESAVVPLTLRFKDGLCTPFTCEYRIFENGIERQRFTIEVSPRGAASSC